MFSFLTQFIFGVCVFPRFPFFVFFSRGGLIPNFGDGSSGFGDQKILSDFWGIGFVRCGFQKKSTIVGVKYPY